MSSSNKFLKPRKDSCGYLMVTLNGKNKLIHRLVAETFLVKIDGLNYVNHIDENKENTKKDFSINEQLLYAYT